MKNKLTGLLAFALAVPVLASPPTGAWESINGDFGAGGWTETLIGGPAGAPGNEWQLAGDSFQLDGALITESVLTESGFGYAQYLTTCAGGQLTLANTEAAPWYNSADPNAAFTVDLGTVEVTTRKLTNPMGLPTGQIGFTVRAEGVAADDPSVAVVLEAGYTGTPGLDTTVEPAALFGALEWVAVTVSVIEPPPSVTLTVDIKPGSEANPVNLSSHGVIPVAILGSADFDVSQIDPSTILLEGVAPVRCSMADLDLDDSDDTLVTGDGFADLKLKFRTAQLAAVLGDFTRNETVVLTLTAQLLDGTAVEGTDTIRVLKNNRKPPKAHKK